MSQIDNFFESPKEHSIVKSDIVSEYFGAWVDIMKSRCEELTYLDLFSGPGKYEEGTPSTPMKIFDVIESKEISAALCSHFYESDRGYRNKLKISLEGHPVFQKLRVKPTFPEAEVSAELTNELPVRDCTFSFVDPHGFKISAKMLATLVSDWGSDCIFYLSTYGIRRNIEIESQEEDLLELFGRDGLNELREKLKIAPSWYVKDRLIIKQLAKRVMEIGGKTFYFLDFAMEFEKSKMVSYYLILITQHHRGFAIMKEIMAKHSYKDHKDIPLYVYSKSKLERENQLQLQFGEKMDELKTKLCRDFENQTLTVNDVLEKCHKTSYIHTKQNLKDALQELELEKEVSIDPPRDQRPIRKGKTTLADNKTVTFHCKKNNVH